MSAPGWITLGVIVAGVVLFVWMLWSLVRHLLALRSAAVGLQMRAEQAQALQSRLEDLQPRVDELNVRVARVQAKLPHR